MPVPFLRYSNSLRSASPERGPLVGLVRLLACIGARPPTVGDDHPWEANNEDYIAASIQRWDGFQPNLIEAQTDPR